MPKPATLSRASSPGKHPLAHLPYPSNGPHPHSHCLDMACNHAQPFVPICAHLCPSVTHHLPTLQCITTLFPCVSIKFNSTHSLLTGSGYPTATHPCTLHCTALQLTTLCCASPVMCHIWPLALYIHNAAHLRRHPSTFGPPMTPRSAMPHHASRITSGYHTFAQLPCNAHVVILVICYIIHVICHVTCHITNLSYYCMHAHHLTNIIIHVISCTTNSSLNLNLYPSINFYSHLLHICQN